MRARVRVCVCVHLEFCARILNTLMVGCLDYLFGHGFSNVVCVCLASVWLG